MAYPPIPFSEADRTNEASWQAEAASIFERLTNTKLDSIQRLTGGSINRVFLCSHQDTKLVLRLAPGAQAQNRRGAAAWANIRHKAGTGVVPYTAIAEDNDPAQCFWMAMPFVEGQDIAKALPGMSEAQQRALAQTLFQRQHLTVQSLEPYSQGDCVQALQAAGWANAWIALG